MHTTSLFLSGHFFLQFESKSPDAKIISGRDAFWNSIVTITTVGYGDFYPVTSGVRIKSMFITFMGVGIIGAWASFLASLQDGGSSPAVEKETPASRLVRSTESSSNGSVKPWG